MHESYAALFLDPRQPGGAVVTGSGHHDGNRPFLVNLGQGAKKKVDGQVRAPDTRMAGQLQVPVVHFQVVRGRYHVHMVGFDGGRLVDLNDRHVGNALQNFGHIAFMIGRKMKNDDKGHAIGSGHLLEKMHQGLQATGRCTDAHHGEVERAFGQLVDVFRVQGSVARICHADKPVGVNGI